ncbi:MAG: tetratricopeptide repeat protein [Sulfuricurvum sp.]|nr:tetratricopeptide repeat protein [Sulfuricurvum sp.]
MKHWLLLSLWLPLSALDLSIQSGKEGSKPYSILHIRDTSSFVCQENRNDFDEIIRIECPIQKASSTSFPPINNTHFTVQYQKTNSGYTIVITPKTKIALYSDGFDLRKDPQMYVSTEKPTKHWSMIGYSGKIPMLEVQNENPNALNLPIRSAKETYPYVGGLDLKGNPIAMKRVQDVTDYMELKKAYKNEDYSKTLSLAKKTLEKYPNTIFKNELLLYQIRALHFMGDNEQLLPLSKQFIRQYSNDSGIAEVLAYAGDSYAKIGQGADSEYFFNRLFTEHENSPFATEGMFLKAQQLEGSGKPKSAAAYYKIVLQKTKDIELASSAAFKLANMKIAFGHLDEAKEYVEKIVRANPNYFSKMRKQSEIMINTYAENKDQKTAAKITLCLMDKSIKKSDEHQQLLKNLGLLYASAGEKDKALKRFDEYLKMYPYGAGYEEVKRAKDGLFFEKTEPKGEAGIKKYNDLIDHYGNDPVGQKALYKKAQLLLKEEKYQEVLAIENDLYRLNSKEFPEASGIIGKSAIALTKKKLEALQCSEAMTLHKMYRIKLEPQWDGLTFDCALRMGNFPVAKKIATPHLKASTIAERELWLTRMTKVYFELGEYKEALRSGKEAVALLEAQKNPKLSDVYRTLFDTAQRMGDDVRMIEYIKGCESTFGTDFKDIERYTQMVSVGLRQKDDLLVQNYANRVMTLQNRTKTYTQSPFIEFTFAQSLMNQEKNNDALKILESLTPRKLNTQQRSRQQYLIGSLAMKLDKTAQAKAAFSASIKIDAKSAWGKLAKDALRLL